MDQGAAGHGVGGPLGQLRAFQLAQGEATLAWLGRRRGW